MISSLTSKKVVNAATHEVFNVSKPLVNYNVFTSDPALIRGMKAFGKGVLDGHRIDSYGFLSKYGAKCGSEYMIETANLAEKNKPLLRQFDAVGNRIDEIDFHPSYHELMKEGKEVGVASYGYTHEKASADSHVTRAALLYMQNQVDPGVCCPLVMTNAAIPVLRRAPGKFAASLASKLCHHEYDGRNVPMEEKRGITAGMSMTEKQGGSDVRANTTTAEPLSSSAHGPGQEYTLRGHKWFTSAPMSDVFLTLAKTPGSAPASSGPSCFIVPRWIPQSAQIASGQRNAGFQVMRLKDKCADRSNASSEVEYDGAWGMMIGEEGKGVKTIIEMVQSTRLDCCLGSAGQARRALMETLHYAANRSAFGSTLIDQPLMQNVLADLCVEAEAMTLMSMKMGSLYNHASNLALPGNATGDSLGGDSKATAEDENMTSEGAMALFRIGVAVSKYYITKRLPNFTYECMEAHGGNGFVEDLPMAKLYRHAPLNSIWEGSGNVIALDVLRAAELIPILMDEIRLCEGIDAHVDRYVDRLEYFLHDNFNADSSICHVSSRGRPQKPLAMSMKAQRNARNIVDQMAIALQASLMLRYGCPNVAEMFIASRIGGSGTAHDGNFNNGGLNYGSVTYSAAAAKLVIDDNMPKFCH